MDPNVPDTDLSESDYLVRQGERAKAALTQAAGEMLSGLGQGVNPGQWAKQYPWATVGASAVAGFVAAALVVPSKEQQALRRLAAIERALDAHKPQPQPVAPAGGTAAPADDGVSVGKQQRNAPSGITGFILRELMSAMKPALISLITAKATKPSQEEMEAAAASEDAKSGGA